MMQPTFLPWLGFFGLICMCDRFVFGDDYQYSAGSFHQRNRLFRNRGEVAWMTVPMQKKRSTGLALNEARIADDPPWRQHMWKQIRNTYRCPPFFADVGPPVEGWLLTPADSLAEQNIGFIRLACELMGLKREFRLSSQRPARLDAIAARGRLAAVVRSSRLPLCRGFVRLHAQRRRSFPSTELKCFFRTSSLRPTRKRPRRRIRALPFHPRRLVQHWAGGDPRAHREPIPRTGGPGTKWPRTRNAHFLSELEPCQEGV